MLYYQLNNLGFPRLGIIASKKKIRLAVLRNKLKRQVRESFRLHRYLLGAYDIVVVTRSFAKEASNYELRQCLDRLFLQLIELGKYS